MLIPDDLPDEAMIQEITKQFETTQPMPQFVGTPKSDSAVTRAWKAEIEAAFRICGSQFQLIQPAGFARSMIPQAKFLLNTEGNKPPPLLAYAREDIEVARRLAAKDAADDAAQSEDQAAAPEADPRWFTGDEPAPAPPGAD